MRALMAASGALVTGLVAGCGAGGGMALRASTPSYAEAYSTPVSDPYYPAHGEPYFDALNYDLDLRWTPATRTLHGIARIDFRLTAARDSLTLDLGRPLSVKKVLLDGATVPFTHPGAHLVVRRPGLARGSRHLLTVRYQGSPRQTPAPVTRADIPGLGWKTRQDGSVWAMQEPWGASTWYPSNDQPSDKAYYSARIVSRGGMQNVFNGRRVSTSTEHGATTTFWKLDQPAASYLITVAIGHYRRYVDKGPHGLPVTYWVPTGADPKYLRTLRRTPAMLHWLEGKLGPYPFARAGTVVVPADSAMETQTLVTMGMGDWANPGVADDLLHEYAHQWLGDTVTTDNWKDLWLNEGLTMYLQEVWSDARGDQPLAPTMRYFSTIDNSLRNRYGPPGEYKKNEFASANVYLSGALMVHRIRAKVGDTVFWNTMRAWVAEHKNRSVDRTDFADFWSARTGIDLHAFVSAWLTAATTPAGP
jgi:aminopeptidase N